MTYFNLKYPWTVCGPLANPGEAHVNGVFQHAPVELLMQANHPLLSRNPVVVVPTF